MSKRTLWLMLAVLGLTAAVFGPAWGTAQPAAAPAGGPKYTIVLTEGTNLVVVDNSTNTLYYYTVDQGKVVEHGRHAELMAKEGRYWDLVRRQEIEEELEQ